MAWSCFEYVLYEQFQVSSAKMPASGDIAKRVANTETEHFAREDNENERLVVSSDQEIKVEDDVAHPQTEGSERSWKWWIKVTLWSIVTIVGSIVLMKWVMPFLFEKV